MPKNKGLLPAKRTLRGIENEEKLYLFNVLENCPNIIVYHKSGPSKLKNYSDVDHFDMLTWHSQHPTCLHSFNILKKLFKMRGSNPSPCRYRKCTTHTGCAAT